MPESSRKLLIYVLLFLGAGLVSGWLYGWPLEGLLLSSLLALGWHVSRLIAFDRALNTRNFDAFRYGEGILQRIYSRLAFERERGARHKRAYRRLLREIRKSTNALPDGAIILNSEGEMVACNRAATKLTGLKRKKDRGHRVDNIIRNPALAKVLKSTDSDASIDIASPRVEGAWLNCRVVPYGADQKLLLIRDVTERVTLSRMRSDLAANASHELRSPLTVISGYLESIVDDPELAEHLAKPVRDMQEQAVRMKGIIDGLLELSHLESSSRTDTSERVDIGAIFERASKTVPPSDVHAEIVIEADRSYRLSGDAADIESVVNNLLSNALRHTEPEDAVSLIWRVDDDGADLIVRDTGEGIEAEHLPRLTERFFRVDRGRSRAEGGIGLGLAIVKHVLERHDAKLHIESLPGEGSEFRCHFPKSRVVGSSP